MSLTWVTRVKVIEIEPRERVEFNRAWKWVGITGSLLVFSAFWWAVVHLFVWLLK
jgi:hypothetical protein